jgi:Tfp pilus assembly protein PilN
MAFEPCEDIRFFHRSLPPEGTDLFLFVEEQITELLSADESLADVIYRFSVSNDGLLIAVARKNDLETKKRSSGIPACRIPAAVGAWLRVRSSLGHGKKSLLFLPTTGNSWLLYADAVQLYYVYRLNNESGSSRELLLALDRIREKYTGTAAVPAELLTATPLEETLAGELRERSMTSALIPMPDVIPCDRTVADQWDFSLPTEIADRQLETWKRRALKSGLFSAGAILLLWLGLAGGNLLLDKAEERSTKRWVELRSSIKEINFLQKETRDLITEITLCQRLAEKRTTRASVLQKIGASRPSEVRLETLRINERKKKFEKGKVVVSAEGQALLQGYVTDPGGITLWMESLLKSGAFTSVNLLSMEKKDGRYRFLIECGLEG